MSSHAIRVVAALAMVGTSATLGCGGQVAVNQTTDPTSFGDTGTADGATHGSDAVAASDAIALGDGLIIDDSSSFTDAITVADADTNNCRAGGREINCSPGQKCIVIFPPGPGAMPSCVTPAPGERPNCGSIVCNSGTSPMFCITGGPGSPYCEEMLPGGPRQPPELLA